MRLAAKGQKVRRQSVKVLIFCSPVTLDAVGGTPPGEVARTSLGAMPNSRRNARLKLEASAKQRISAILLIDKVLAASLSSVKLSESRRC